MVPAAILAGYEGYFQLDEFDIVIVTRDGQRLFIQLSGQGTVEIFPEREAEFFARALDVQTRFTRNAQGRSVALVLHQDGIDHTAPRVDAAAVQRVDELIAQRIARGTAAPGGEQLLRRNIDSAQDGHVLLDDLSPFMAQVVQSGLAQWRADLQPYGKVRSIQFRGIGPGGADIYLVEHEHGTLEWRITLDSNGKIVRGGYRKLH